MKVHNDHHAIMLLGHPYTGKSTWVENFPHKDDYHYWNLDHYLMNVLKEMGLEYSNDNFQKYVRAADKKLRSDAHKWISKGENIIIDRTNTRKKSRIKIAKRLKNAGYKITCVKMKDLTDDVIESRTKIRTERVVPMAVVKDMRDNANWPDAMEIMEYYDMYIDNETARMTQ